VKTATPNPVIFPVSFRTLCDQLGGYTRKHPDYNKPICSYLRDTYGNRYEKAFQVLLLEEFPNLYGCFHAVIYAPINFYYQCDKNCGYTDGADSKLRKRFIKKLIRRLESMKGEDRIIFIQAPSHKAYLY
jgi:hypothetical protein